MECELTEFERIKACFLGLERELNKLFFPVELQGSWEVIDELEKAFMIVFNKNSISFEFFLKTKGVQFLLPLSKLKDPIFTDFLINQFELFMFLTTCIWEISRHRESLSV